MRPWIEPHAIEVPEALRTAVGGHPLVAQVLLARGVESPEAAMAFFDPAATPKSDPLDLPDLDIAVARLVKAIRDQEPVLVWGDFDVDGQTSTTLLVTTLQQLGTRVSFHIPVREIESHGVNLPVLKRLLAPEVGSPRIGLVLTCDTGITAHEAMDYAASRGVDMIITDHHDLPPSLPAALAVVNPKRLPPGHALSNLPGVGVAYQLAEALCRSAGQPALVEQNLDLAALGIVADLASLKGETRVLLQRGLAALRRTRRAGLLVMMELAEVDPANLTEEHIGFLLGPRLNALGRLADANVSVEFLTTNDLSRARVIATTLEGLNAERKQLTEQVYQGALAQLSRQPEFLDDAALVLWHPAWPGGVIGIVASRLVERYHRPVVLFSAPPGQTARGSARSIEGINITAAIAAHQELLAGFGGHPMAAGLSIAPGANSMDARITAFRKALARTVKAMAGDIKTETSLSIDGYLPLTDLSLDLVKDLERLAPFGPGNPPLTLASRDLVIKGQSKIGRNGEHLALIVEDATGASQKVIWWQAGASPNSLDLPQGRFDLAYTVRASNYRGQLEVQVEWIDARPLDEPDIPAPAAQTVEVIDYRASPQPSVLVKTLAGQEGLLVWAEAEAAQKLSALGISSVNRVSLKPARALVIWTTPPGPRELRSAIAAVRPQMVYLFGIPPETTAVGTLLKRLAGLVKYSLRSEGGRCDLGALAAACAQREGAVRLGLEWLAVRGDIAIQSLEGGQIVIVEGSRVVQGDPIAIADRLKPLLDESAAYRAYFASADKDGLIFPV